MPLKRTAWACQYGCRHRLVSGYEGMRRHEARCFHNPETKSCATCANYFPGTKPHDPDEPPEPWACRVGERNFDKEGLTTNCPQWEMKGNQ